jgi:hypothetical protein
MQNKKNLKKICLHIAVYTAIFCLANDKSQNFPYTTDDWQYVENSQFCCSMLGGVCGNGGMWSPWSTQVGKNLHSAMKIPKNIKNHQWILPIATNHLKRIMNIISWAKKIHLKVWQFFLWNNKNYYEKPSHFHHKIWIAITNNHQCTSGNQ